MKISKSLPTFVAEQFVTAISEVANIVCGYTPSGKNVTSQVTPEARANAKLIQEFTRGIWRNTEKGAGFLTIFKGKEKRMKVNDVSGLACVMTTGLLRQLVGNYISCSSTGSGAGTSPGAYNLPCAKKVLDVLRYMEEVGLDAIEFSMRGRKTSNPTSEMANWVYLSDRYQEDSWKQHLKTDFPNYDTSSGVDFPCSVALAEMNTL